MTLPPDCFSIAVDLQADVVLGVNLCGVSRSATTSVAGSPTATRPHLIFNTSSDCAETGTGLSFRLAATCRKPRLVAFQPPLAPLGRRDRRLVIRQRLDQLRLRGIAHHSEAIFPGELQIDLEAVRQLGLLLLVVQLLDEHPPGARDLCPHRAGVRPRVVPRRAGADDDAGRVHVVMRPDAIAGAAANIVDGLPIGHRRVVASKVFSAKLPYGSPMWMWLPLCAARSKRTFDAGLTAGFERDACAAPTTRRVSNSLEQSSGSQPHLDVVIVERRLQGSPALDAKLGEFSIGGLPLGEVDGPQFANQPRDADILALRRLGRNRGGTPPPSMLARLAVPAARQTRGDIQSMDQLLRNTLRDDLSHSASCLGRRREGMGKAPCRVYLGSQGSPEQTAKLFDTRKTRPGRSMPTSPAGALAIIMQPSTSKTIDCLSVGILVADHLCEPIDHVPAAGEVIFCQKLPLAIGGCASNVAVDLGPLGRWRGSRRLRG